MILQQQKEKFEATSELEPILDSLIQSLTSLPAEIKTSMFNYRSGESIENDLEIQDFRNRLIFISSKLEILKSIIYDSYANMSSDQQLVLDIDKPNWKQITAQFQSYLAAEEGWSNMYTGSISLTLAELIASVAAWLMQGLNVAFMESFLTTAQRDSSIYANTSALGVYINRKTSASVQCDIERTDLQSYVLNTQVTNGSIVLNDNSDIIVIPSMIDVYYGNVRLNLKESIAGTEDYTISNSVLNFHPSMEGKLINIQLKHLPTQLIIDKFSSFNVSQQKFYNKEPIIFNIGELKKTVTLTEGERRIYLKSSSSLDFQSIKLPEGEFSISNEDILLKINNEYWTLVPALWTAGPNDKCFVQKTTGDGYTTILIGNGVKGKNVTLGSVISIEYTINSGASGNNSNTQLRVKGDNTLGYTVSQVSGGSNEKDAEVYKLMASDMFDAKGNLVKKKDIRAYVLDMPNIADVIVLNQADLGKYDLRLMNVLTLCVLPYTELLTDTEKDNIKSLVLNASHPVCDIAFINPEPLLINVKIKAHIFNNVVESQVIQTITDSINEVFTKSVKSLGKTVTISDIVTKAIIEYMVDYVEVLLNGDVTDIYIERTRYPVLGKLDISLIRSSR
jgi:hypothetical protein